MNLVMNKESEGLATELDRRWQAVVQRDPSARGTFVYAVKTTGVYCRPSCGRRSQGT